MKGWKIIYNDGTNITKTSSKTSTWNNAPAIDVQFVIIYYDNFRRVFSGLDQYTLEIPNAQVKTGKLISNKEFQRTRKDMINDRFGSDVS